MSVWVDEYQRRLAYLFEKEAGRPAVGDITVLVGTIAGGYCDTCSYQFEALFLHDDNGKVQFGYDIDMGEFIRALDAVPDVE